MSVIGTVGQSGLINELRTAVDELSPASRRKLDDTLYRNGWESVDEMGDVANCMPSVARLMAVGALVRQLKDKEDEVEQAPATVSYVSVNWSDGFTLDLTLPELYAVATELRARYVK